MIFVWFYEVFTFCFFRLGRGFACTAGWFLYVFMYFGPFHVPYALGTLETYSIVGWIWFWHAVLGAERKLQIDMPSPIRRKVASALAALARSIPYPRGRIKKPTLYG